MTRQAESTGRAGRRTQQERSSATIQDFLTAARKLFARDGYTSTALEAICDEVGATKGALYHHFRNKEHLFRLVYEREQQQLSVAITETYALYDDHWEGLYHGIRAFLVGSMESGTQRITLIDAPGAIGWEVMREIRADCRALMRYGLIQAIGRNRFRDHEIEALTSVLYGAQCESVVAIARAEDQNAMLEATLSHFRLLFRSLQGDARRVEV